MVSYTYGSNKNCTHYDAQAVITWNRKGLPPITFYAGSKLELQEIGPLDLVLTAIDDAGFRKPPFQYTEGVGKLFAKTPELFTWKQTEVIKLEWPDRGIPVARPSWWKDLVAALRVAEEIETVGMCCLGGHGRTGTMLAILAGHLKLAGGSKQPDPVAWTRKHYCGAAVESMRQIFYIEKALGCPEIETLPSDQIKLPITQPATKPLVNTTNNKKKEAQPGKGNGPFPKQEQGEIAKKFTEMQEDREEQGFSLYEPESGLPIWGIPDAAGSIVGWEEFTAEEFAAYVDMYAEDPDDEEAVWKRMWGH